MAFMYQPPAVPQAPPVPAQAPQAPPPQQQGGAQAPSTGQTKYNHFDAPIPGQSLTETPGNAKWEHPPQFAEPEKAMNYVYDQLMRPDSIRQTIGLLKQDVPVEGIVRTILFTGFANGKWTPDTAMLMAKPLTQTIVAIAKRANIPNVQVMMDPEQGKEPLKQMAALDAQKQDTNAIVMGPEKKSGFLNRSSIRPTDNGGLRG